MTTDLVALDKQEEQMSNVDQLKLQLRESREVQQIARSVDLKDQVAVLEIGKVPADQMSGFSGRVLNSMQAAKLEESSVLLTQLGKLMDRFDPKDFAEDKGIISRIFNKGKKYIDKIMAKYQTMGTEIDKFYIEITKYESEMKQSTTVLEQLHTENYNYYMELEKYIVATELLVEKMKNEIIPPIETRANSGDQMAGMELTSSREILELLEGRVYDLEMAKQVAMQTAPQIRMLQKGNTKLIAKINSAFVITIPVFKNALIQAVAAKRQKLVADSMNALDARTNEMLLKNATNISEQSKEIARMAGQPSIKLETMETTWQTIMDGMKETKAIEEENARTREAGKKRLQELQASYEQAKLNG